MNAVVSHLLTSREHVVMLFDVKSLPANAFAWVAPCSTCANKQEVPLLFVVSLPMLMAEGHSD